MSLSQCESNDDTSIPITNHRCVDMPIAKHREEVILFYLISAGNKAENHHSITCFVFVLSVCELLLF